MGIPVPSAILLLIHSLAALNVPDQKPLAVIRSSSSLQDVVHKLKLGEVIPTVLDRDFHPRYLLEATWGPGHNVSLGNTLPPNDLKIMPFLALERGSQAHLAVEEKEAPLHRIPWNLVFTLTDPDAPSRDNPVWSEVCHLIVYVRNYRPWSSITTEEESTFILEELLDTDYADVLPIMPYKPPGPPPKTGKHRYVFTTLTPQNGTSERLHLRKPAERYNWGYEHIRAGLMDWSREHELIPIAANFFYSQNDEQ